MKRFFKRLYKIIQKPEMRILPGQLAFFLVLSIIPLVALIATISANFSLSIESLMEIINDSLPKEIASFINAAIDGKSMNLNIAIFYISAFILASNGPHSMIIGANMIYKVESKDYITRRIKAIIMTIILVILLLFMLIVPAYGDTLISLLGEVIKAEPIITTISTAYTILKYPISFLLIFFCIKLLYTMAPDTQIASKTTTSGALFTTVTWIIATEVYSFYVNTFNSYNLLYGSIANLLILLLWVYLLSYVFVVGMALNASREDVKKENETNNKEQLSV